MTEISFSKAVEMQEPVFSGLAAFLPFYKNDSPLEGDDYPKWGMSVLKAGNMRFRWNESNFHRDSFLSSLFKGKSVLPVELSHSKTVYYCDSEGGTKNFVGDGILTKNKSLVPVITVADCVPIFVFDSKNRIFGSLHSGWKGTGIVLQAIRMLEEKGAEKKDISIAIGPHIESCYYVSEERAQYFIDNFGSSCVEINENAEPLKRYRLSLLQANLLALKKINFPFENVVAADDCTFETKKSDGTNLFGSCRREGEGFTVQAAFAAFNLH